MGNPSVIILDHWLIEKAAATLRAVYKVQIRDIFPQTFPLLLLSGSKRLYMPRDYKEKGML